MSRLPSPQRSTSTRRRGFALPLVILVIAVLTAGLVASFAAASAEFGTTNAQRAQSRSFAIAQSGLELYLRARDSLCTAKRTGETCIADLAQNAASTTTKADSFRISIAGGYADIVAHQLRNQVNDTLPAVYFIRSRGVDTLVRVSGRDTSVSQRAVGIMAQYNTNVMSVLGAWTSLSGIQKFGTAGLVSGIDQCGMRPSVAGIVVPKGDFDKSGNWTAEGNPPADSTSTLTQLEGRMKIDWASIVKNNAIPADIEIPPGNFPSAAVFQADTTWWPVIRIHTNGFSLPNAGRGIIIADTDFVISGSNMWDGIVLVGGKLTSNGNNTTSGATISGLNLLLPGYPQPAPGYINDDATLNGTKDYEYNSCKVSKAATKLKKFVAFPNTWFDDVPTW